MKFEEILTLASFVTGIIWLLDIWLFKPKRIAADGSIQAKEPIIVEYSKSFFPVLFLVLVLRSFVAEPFRIPSGSMKPTLLVGDFIVVNKFKYGFKLPVIGTKLISVNSPKRGDVIIFRHLDGKDLIKRVVGLPGDHILYKDKVLHINNQPVTLTDGKQAKDNLTPAFYQREGLNDKVHDIYTYPDRRRNNYPVNDVTVPENSYFVMGDNRDDSLDSRFWGFVEEEKIIGKAFATWWSWDWNDWSIAIRWNRIGKSIS